MKPAETLALIAKIRAALSLAQQRRHHHHHHGAWPMSNPGYLANLAVAALESGVTVQSSGSPTLNGSYPIDSLSLQKYGLTSMVVGSTGAFPGGAASWTILDVNGQPHTFSAPAEFTSFVDALVTYVLSLYQIVDGVNTAATDLPSPTLNIP